MEILNHFQMISIYLLSLLESILIVLFFISIVIIYHISMHFIFDKKDLNYLKKIKDPESISIKDLKEIPIVNIIVPAWKEGQVFNELLLSIKNLKYPRIKAIINAGGNDETLEIAHSFKKYENFVILHQKGGASRPSLGKIKALNECLPHVSEGIVYFLDADSYLDDEILLRMIYPIVNFDENVVGGKVRPLKSQLNNNLVKYLQIDRLKGRRFKFLRHEQIDVINGQNLCVKYEVIKAIDKFSEIKNYATDKTMGINISSKGFTKSYQVLDYRHRIYVDYSNTIRDYMHQKIIWTENFLIESSRNNKIKLFKFIGLFFLSLYILMFPLLLLINFGLFFIGFLIFLNAYLNKIRKLIFFKQYVDIVNYEKYTILFYFTLIFYIFMEAIIIVVIPFHFVHYLKKVKSFQNKIN